MDGLRGVREAGAAEDALERRTQAQVGEPGRRGRPRVVGIAEAPERADHGGGPERRPRGRVGQRHGGGRDRRLRRAGPGPGATSAAAALGAAPPRPAVDRAGPGRCRPRLRVRRPAPGSRRLAHGEMSRPRRLAAVLLPPVDARTRGKRLVHGSRAPGPAARRRATRHPPTERRRQPAPRGAGPSRPEPPVEVDPVVVRAELQPHAFAGQRVGRPQVLEAGVRLARPGERTAPCLDAQAGAERPAPERRSPDPEPTTA